MIVKKTEKQILSDVYFDGFSCRKKDESTLNKLWISAESLRELLEDSVGLTADQLVDKVISEVFLTEPERHKHYRNHSLRQQTEPVKEE